MQEDNFNQEEINRLINSAWSGEPNVDVSLLRPMYEERLAELGISSNQVETNLEIGYRTLNGILDGDLQRFDLLSLVKIGHFLGIKENRIVEIYLRFVSEKHKEDIEKARRRTFILNNFDLPALKNSGVINSIQNFDAIEQQLNTIFGLKSITDYNTEDTGAALSSSNIKPKNDKTRKYFKNKARLIFQLINNPHRYDKQALIDYFPKIRWHSTDKEKGLINVIKSLFDLGVTVIFQPKMASLQMRGATFAVNGKPCIVLTNYRESYPTLWFAFLHELFHVLFDWDEISKKKYHLSDEENDLQVIKQKEDEANEFAREYLFPTSKLEVISKRINQKVIVREFALEHHVHPSIIYANYAFQNTDEENNYWAEFESSIHPKMDSLIKNLSNDLTAKSSAADFATYYRKNIFNLE